MKVKRIFKLATKTIAVVLLAAAFTVVGYSFGLRGANRGTKNQGVVVNLLGKATKVDKDEITIQTLATPFESSESTRRGGIAIVRITNKTEFSKAGNGEAGSLGRPRRISYSAIKRGDLVTVLAVLGSDASLKAEKVMVISDELTTGEPPKGREMSKPPEITNISGIVKEVGDRRFVLEITAGTTVTFLVDEGTEYMKGPPAPGGKPDNGSFSDVKLGVKVVAIGEKNPDGSIKAKAVFIEER